ncbi:MAG: hypothetical protein SFT92_06205 [Rickettsiales bacterium]|nr:hypothetical protein [Rickettsiales bacterium]
MKPRARSFAVAIDWNRLPVMLGGLMLLIVAVAWSQQQQPRIEEYTLETLRKLRIEHTAPKSIAQHMTVEAAYKATGVQFTPFVPAATKMSKGDANYIKSLFDLINIGVVERVSLLNNLNNPAMRKSIVRNHGEILRRIDTLAFPAHLEKLHLLILHAVYEEKEYFDILVNNPSQRFDPMASLVVSSDKKLRAAYQILMDTYVEEDEKTRQSFYSQLCALSFI